MRHRAHVPKENVIIPNTVKIAVTPQYARMALVLMPPIRARVSSAMSHRRDYCDGNTAVSYDAVGSCTDGNCDYNETITECLEGSTASMVPASRMTLC